MTSKKAWAMGWQTLRRYPWLALIPMGWSLLQILMAWIGFPQGPVFDATQLEDWRGFAARPYESGGFTISLWLVLPSWLPSVADLGVAVQPESLAFPARVQPWALVGAVLLVPAVSALVEATYLVLLARAVTEGEADLRKSLPQILRALPGLFFLEVLWHVMYLTLPIEWMLFIRLLWPFFYALWPLVIAAGDQSLGAAFLEAPVALWTRFGAWFGLVWRVFLLTVPFTLVWSLLGRFMWTALLFYPILATGAIAAAVALYLNPEHEEAAPAPAPPRAWIGALAVGVLLAAGGSHLASQWEGFRVSRQAALHGQSLFQPLPFHQTLQEGNSEYVMYEAVQGMGIAELEHSRFGWKVHWREEWPVQVSRKGDSLSPRVFIRETKPSLHPGRSVLWGKVFDFRAAAIEIAGTAYPLKPGDPYFIILTTEESSSEKSRLQQVRLLDANGDPLPGEGGTEL